MTLEEAKLQVNISIKSPLFKRNTCIVPIEAIKIILNYIENESIPKEKVKELITDLKEEFDANNSKGIYGNDYYIISEQYAFAEEKLEELLEK